MSPYPQRPRGSGWWLGYCLSAYIFAAACWFHMCCWHQPTFPPPLRAPPHHCPFTHSCHGSLPSHNWIFIFWPHCVGCRILVPWPVMKPMPPAVEAQSPISRKFPHCIPCNLFYFCGIHNVPSFISDCCFFCEFFFVCEILVPQPRMEPVLPALGAWSPNHWTSREVPWLLFFESFIFFLVNLRVYHFSWSVQKPIVSFVDYFSLLLF